MYEPMLFRDRPRPAQIALGGVVPAIAGMLLSAAGGRTARLLRERRSPRQPG